MQNIDLLNIILKRKIPLAIVVVSAGILAVVFSSPYFIKPKYKSTAIIYPSNLMPYSQESPTEQMLQLFQSDSVFNHVVNHFHLIQHYGLDSSDPVLRHKLLGIYHENVSIKKTEFEAVKIEVMDGQPEVACEMIKEMINAFNGYTLKLNHQKSEEMMRLFSEQLMKKQLQIDSINTALKELAVKFGIIDYEAQSRELSKEYYRTLASGNEKKISDLTNAMRNLEEKGGQFNELQLHLKNSTKEYGTVLKKYNIVKSDAEKVLTYTNVVLNPIPADKKAYPIRWLIVTVAICASFLFSLFVIIIIEGRKQ